VNYDLTNIPVAYDRGRDHGPEVLELWMDVLASTLGTDRVSTIVDLGCGTGRFSEGLARRFDACVVGIDPSALGHDPPATAGLDVVNACVLENRSTGRFEGSGQSDEILGRVELGFAREP
jgi:SAM-dependent methyltransferase